MNFLLFIPFPIVIKRWILQVTPPLYMNADTGLTLSRLSARHLDAARQLSLEAGWNQTLRDWERLLELDPAGCIGGFLDDELIGTVTLVSLGDRAGWIGMMLVKQSCRENGYGRRLFQEVLREADTRSLDIVGLDATHLGLPLYRSEGFHAVSTMSRWSGAIQPPERSTPVTDLFEDFLTDAAVELDHRFSGVDRRFLIRTLLQEDEITRIGQVRDGELRGFALSRPGEHSRHIGPVVADSPDLAGLLLAELGRRHPTDSVLIDLKDRPDMDRQLLRLGLTPQRRLTRMTRPGPLSILDSPKLPVIVSFEWG